METASSDAALHEAPSPASGPRKLPRRLMPGSAHLLERTVVPALRRRHDRRLSHLVLESVREGDAERVAELPERDRRTLLEVLEAGLNRRIRSTDPRAVVDLTALLGAVPEPGVRLSRWRTAPAR